MNKEIIDALYMLLHCSLKDTEYETQKEQFKAVYDYICSLEQENAKAKGVIDKAIDYIQETDCCTWDNSSHEDLLDILKEVK